MKNILFAAIILLPGIAISKKNVSEKSRTVNATHLDKDLIFHGTPLQQAQFLLREIKEKGIISKDSAILLSPLRNLIGDTVCYSVEKFKIYAEQQNISLNELGLLVDSCSDTATINSKVDADYFVIHDASTPNYGSKPFPANINEAGWAWNNLDIWKKNVTHVYINRLGQSKTINDFSDAMQATKFEKKVLGGKAAGRFIHVELIQPRKNQAYTSMRGSLAPAEGFTVAQYQRLALLYVFASIRKGNWLIPAFHACIDDGIYNGHDDPQHFSLVQWNAALGKLLRDFETINSKG